MTIRKLIELLQAHGDDGTAEVQLSYEDHNADICVSDITGIRLELSTEAEVLRIILEGH